MLVSQAKEMGMNKELERRITQVRKTYSGILANELVEKLMIAEVAQWVYSADALVPADVLIQKSHEAIELIRAEFA